MKAQLKTRTESKRYPGLFVEKYTRRVFYENLWDADLVESRGSVFDAEGNVVIRPFTKIFNRFENNTNICLSERVLAVEKINGFMAAVTYVPALGKSIVSTTGSLDSDYVLMAEDMLPASAFRMADRFAERPITFLYEIVHPDDPHIIKEQEGVYLIGSRVVSNPYPYSSSLIKEKLLDIMAHAHPDIYRPTWTVEEFEKIVEKNNRARHEGYVVYGQDVTLKMKSPFYLATKFLGRLSKNKIQTLLKNPLQFKQCVDEEFYPLVEAIASIRDVFAQYTEQQRISYIKEFLKYDGPMQSEDFFGV